MKVKDVMEKIRNYHPSLGEHEATTVDTLKSGDPEMEVTGIVTTCTPNLELIRKVAGTGYNMIICHEPTFYSHRDNVDWLEGDPVYEAKKKLLDESGIAILRDHDHLHRHNPDGMYTGVMMELGWEKYRIDPPDATRPSLFELPKTTVKELVAFLKSKLDIEITRVIGSINGECSRVMYKGGGGFGGEYDVTTIMREQNVDVVIAGELIDWTAASYCRDAAALGLSKTVVHIGHMNSEDLGMKHAPVWLREILGNDIPIKFIRSGDPYKYI